MTDAGKCSREELARQVERLYNRLEGRIDNDLDLTFTHNRVQYVSFRIDEKTCWLRLHRAFLEAPDGVLEALAGWIREPKRGTPPAVRQFIRSVSPKYATSAPARRIILRPIGFVYDLRPIFRELNEQHFGGQVNAGLTWGRNVSRSSVRKRRLGSYHRNLHLISVHPVLDDARVPRHFVAYILYHEMVHSLQPKDHKRPHDAVFRKGMRAFPDFKQARDWERANLKLLGLHPVPSVSDGGPGRSQT